MNKKDLEQKTFEINDHTIEYTTWVTDKIEQDLINLNDVDKEFISYSLTDADILLKQLDSEKSIFNYSATDLDDLIDLWKTKRSSFRLVQEEEFVNAIGAAFGNCINKTFNFIWSIISDEYGTDFACISKESSLALKTFPFDSVWKSIEQNDRKRALQSIIELVRKHLDEESL